MNENKIKLVLHQISEEAVPDDLDGWNTIETRLLRKMAQRYPTPRQMFKVNYKLTLALANLVLVVVVIVALTFFLRPQQTVSAAQVLMNAIQAQRMTKFGITSYKGVIQKKFDQGKTEIEEHVWWEYPVSRRVEVYRHTLPEGAVQQLDTSLALSHPSDPSLILTAMDIRSTYQHYWYSVDMHGIVRNPTGRPAQDFIMDMGGGMLGPGKGLLWIVNWNNVQDIVKSLEADVTDIRSSGQETVAGRPAYVIQFTSINGPRGAISSGTQVTAWVDQETYMLLGERWEDPNGKLISEWRFSDVVINLDLGTQNGSTDTIFGFRSNGKALVMDAATELRTTRINYSNLGISDSGDIITPDSFAELVQHVQKHLDYKLFLPQSFTTLPGLMTSPPMVDLNDGTTTIKYQAVDNPMSLIIVQGSPAVLGELGPCRIKNSDVNAKACEQVTVGSDSGQYLENTEKDVKDEVEGWVSYTAQVRWLSLVKDGTQILLRAEYSPDYKNFEVSKDDLIKVAASLQVLK